MIGGRKIRVQCVSYIDTAAAGEWDGVAQVISVNTASSTEDGQADTLLHEIIEAINDMSDLQLPHATITTLTTNLFAVIRQNSLTFLQDKRG